MPVGYTQVSATSLVDSSGVLVANATIGFYPVNNASVPLSFKVGSGGQAMSVPVTAQVTNGAFTIQLADTTLTNPVNVGYAVSVIDNVTGKSLLGGGYGCVQPSGATWNFDAYIPNQAPQIPVTAGPKGDRGDDGTITSPVVTPVTFNAGLTVAGGTVTDRIQTGSATAPANTDTYMKINKSNLLSNSALNQGLSIFDTASGTAGIDLGFLPVDDVAGSRFRLRHFIPASAQWAHSFGFSPANTRPTGQSSFTEVMVLTQTQARIIAALFLTGNFTLTGNQTVSGSVTAGSVITAGLTLTNSKFVSGTTIAPADTGGYSTLNQGTNGFGLNSGSGAAAALNQGIGVFQAAGKQFFGLDFGGGPLGPQTRLFAQDNGKITMSFFPQANGAPTTQDSFTIVPFQLSPTLCKIFGAQIDATGNLTAVNITASGSFTAAALSLALGSALTSSDATAPNHATTLIQVMSLVMSKQLAVRNFIYPRTGMGYRAYGDSITAGAGLVGGQGYASLVAVDLGVTLTNRAVGGDEAADTSLRAFGFENSSITSNVFYSVMIGTNDANGKGVGAHEIDFNTFHQATLSWLATRSEDRVTGGSVTATNWATDTTFAAVTGLKSTTNGAAATYAVTTYGEPLYVWSIARDANAGVFTIAIDGGTPISVNCFGAATIATANGATSGVQLTRIPVAAGAHSVVITVTSPTSASNIVTIVALGTPSQHSYYASPSVAVGGVTPQSGDVKNPITTQYTLDVLNNILLLQSDGLDLRYVDSRTPLKDGLSTLYQVGAANLHPNAAGAAVLHVPFVTALQLPPSESVNKGTPASATAKGTPGDSWAAAGFVYGVQSFGAIQRVATATW